MNDFLRHGRIIGGLATVPDLAASLGDYRDRLGLAVVEHGALPAGLAASWGCAANAGAPFATLAPASGAPSYVRLVEQPLDPGFMPTRTYGWAAFEITVQDIFGWPARLAGSGFDIIGPPREIPGLPYFVAMQMLGQGREVIYLNEVRENTPTADLPPARSLVDHVFIVILATPDRAGTMAWYADRLGLEEGGCYTIPYTMINKAFALPDTHMTSLSMAQKGRMPIVEIDDYPAVATARATCHAMLPPGNALVTLAVNTLDCAGLDFIAPAVAWDGPFYAGRRAATMVGPAGELIELVEIS